jgi:uncharacterized protein
VAPGMANLLLQLVGVACCAVVLVRSASDLRSWRYRRRQRATWREQRATQLAEKIDAAYRLANARRGERLAWPGTRPLRVAAIVDEATDLRSFYLTTLDGSPLPRFEPGQYLTLHLPVVQGEPPVVRCYSLSDRPNSDYYRLTIKHDRASVANSNRPGIASSFLHQRVQVGDALECSAPQGAFVLDSLRTGPVMLIGAGVGVTPLLSMALTVCREYPQREVYLVLGFRDRAHHPFKRALEELAASAPKLRLFTCYSKPAAGDQQFRDYHQAGRVTATYLQQILPSLDLTFYLCGPAAMMHSLVPELLDAGVADDAIHYEAFGPASIRRKPKLVKTTELASGKVRFAARGIEGEWDGRHDSILELAEELGVPIASGCRAGNCGQCQVKVLNGKVQRTKRAGFQADGEACLTCISIPNGTVVVEA